MPIWLQVFSTAVAGAFTIGTIVRGVGVWVWTHTIKRDLARINERLDELQKQFDSYDGSAIWGEVESKVGNIEVDQKLLRQSVVYVEGRLITLENNFNSFRERRRPEDYRNQS